jgi:hypothetical protein
VKSFLCVVCYLGFGLAKCPGSRDDFARMHATDNVPPETKDETRSAANEKRENGFSTVGKRWSSFFESHWTFLLVAYGVATGYFVVIDWRVRSIVKDADFIADVARRTRPALVFDSIGRILSDAGALQLLEAAPSVDSATWGETKITIRPKSWLASPPIVESLDLGSVSVRTEPEAGNVWVAFITARYSPIVADEGPEPKKLAPPRFRLEIIAPR